MASDVAQAAQTATNAGMGLIGRAGNFMWNRITPFKASGIYLTLGLPAAVVGLTWAFMPAAMAAATTTAAATVTPTAGAWANTTSLISQGLGQVVSAVKVNAAAVSSVDWSALGAGGGAKTLADAGAAADQAAQAALSAQTVPGFGLTAGPEFAW